MSESNEGGKIPGKGEAANSPPPKMNEDKDAVPLKVDEDEGEIAVGPMTGGENRPIRSPTDDDDKPGTMVSPGTKDEATSPDKNKGQETDDKSSTLSFDRGIVDQIKPVIDKDQNETVYEGQGKKRSPLILCTQRLQSDMLTE